MLAAAAPFNEMCLWTKMFMRLTFSRGCDWGASAPVGIGLGVYEAAWKVHVLGYWRALTWKTTVANQCDYCAIVPTIVVASVA